MCIGSNVAMQGKSIKPEREKEEKANREELAMKLVIASTYSNFETYIVDDSGVEQADAYVAGPKGKVFLGFKQVKANHS